MPRINVQGALVSFQIPSSGEYPLRLVERSGKKCCKRCIADPRSDRMCKELNQAALAAGLSTCWDSNLYYALKPIKRR